MPGARRRLPLHRPPGLFGGSRGALGEWLILGVAVTHQSSD
jgi:hypothetical protein